MSKPCKNCTEMLKMLNIRNIYYSDNNGNIINERVRDLQNNHMAKIINNLVW